MTQDPGTKADLYGSAYGNFSEKLYAEVRQETWGEEFGQSGWITAAEQDECIGLLGLARGARLLDVACGSGGPTLRMVERAGVVAHGIDIHQDGIAAARKQAEQRGLLDRATFEICDASGPLPFADGSFDAVTCIDAINHLPDREKALSEFARVLEPGGKLLFTDPIVVTGALSKEEIATRSSIGFFLFVAPDYDDRVLQRVGLETLVKRDTTESVALLAGRWLDSRARRASGLRDVEGDQKFEGLQRFLEVASRIARERRLSRFLYVARK
jgi:SAM-dependent methyltransferase